MKKLLYVINARVCRSVAILVFTLIIVNPASAQNLINNSGFETYSSLPTGPGQWSKATSWSNVNGWIPFQWPYASPDYCHANGSGNVQLPNTVFGSVNAFSGNGVMGFITYYPSTFNFREYLAQQLSSAMTVGNTYTVSFYITNGVAGSIGGMGIEDFGVCLSAGPLSQTDHEPIIASPQWTSGSVLYNTSWQYVTFNIVATQAFDHITFGNFETDANTTSQTFVSVSSPGAYYFMDETAVEPASVLPIELVDFRANAVDNHHVELDWETSMEVNNDFFTIEKSVDGINWETVLTKDGAGNSSTPINYKDVDRSPSTGTSFYRLKQSDYDGAQEISDARSVFISEWGEANVSVFPNPTSGMLNVVSSEFELEGLQLINELGQNITSGLTIQVNGERATIDLTDLSPGIYVVKTENSIHKVSKH